MKILIAGTGGKMPPTTYGGIERGLWEMIPILREMGQEIGLSNSPNRVTINGLLAQPWKYDLIHLNWEFRAKQWVKIARWFNKPLLITPRHGHVAKPDLWGDTYRHRVMPLLLKNPYMVSFSSDVDDMLEGQGYSGKVFHFPNGRLCSEIRCLPQATKTQAVMLARVEKRKKQIHFGEIMKAYPHLECDLIGPLSPEVPADFNGNGSNVRFLGPWSREQINSNLTEYPALVLISTGEGQPGAVIEAMAAGLSLVLSPEAAVNIDTSLPFVHVVDRENPAQVAHAIETAIRENARYRADIRKYCEATFDWHAILPRYVEICEEVVRDFRTHHK